MNKQLIASFMLDGGLEDFISDNLTYSDLDSDEIDLLFATGGLVTNLNGKRVLIAPNEDKTGVICLERTGNTIQEVDYHISWEELSNILEKEQYEPSWYYPNLPILPVIQQALDNYAKEFLS